jgi:hypothetical protein
VLFLDFLCPAFDSFLKLTEAVFVSIKLHVLFGLHEGSDQLTACFAHDLKKLIIEN